MNTLYRTVKASERLPEVERNYHVFVTQEHQGYNHIDSAIYKNGKWDFLPEYKNASYIVVEWLEPIPVDKSLEEDKAWIEAEAWKCVNNRLPYSGDVNHAEMFIAGANAYTTHAEGLRERVKQRIKELNEADALFCDDRWNMKLPEMQRKMAREESNKVTFARQELEQLLTQLHKNK